MKKPCIHLRAQKRMEPRRSPLKKRVLPYLLQMLELEDDEIITMVIKWPRVLSEMPFKA